MIYCAVVVCALISIVGSTSPTGALETCSRLCERKYDFSLEDACIGGCKKGEVKGLNQNTSEGCNEWCSSSHKASKDLTEACTYGCTSYAPETTTTNWTGVFRRASDVLRNFFWGTMRRLGMPCAQDSTPAPPTPTSTKPGFIIVRRFHISWPLFRFAGGNDEPGPEMMHPSRMHQAMMGGDGPIPPGMIPFPGMMMRNPIERLMHFGEDEEPFKVAQADSKEPPMMPAMFAMRVEEPKLTDKIGYGLRYLGSHPIVLLFTVTLITLCVLFAIQLVVECRRHRNRNNQFQYNQFDHLPTYVEATMIKIPTDDNAGSFDEKSEKQLKV